VLPRRRPRLHHHYFLPRRDRTFIGSTPRLFDFISLLLSSSVRAGLRTSTFRLRQSMLQFNINIVDVTQQLAIFTKHAYVAHTKIFDRDQPFSTPFRSSQSEVFPCRRQTPLQQHPIAHLVSSTTGLNYEFAAVCLNFRPFNTSYLDFPLTLTTKSSVTGTLSDIFIYLWISCSIPS